MQISPSSPISTSSPLLSNSSTLNNGLGFPIEPNLASNQIYVPIVNAVSVCLNPSLY